MGRGFNKIDPQNSTYNTKLLAMEQHILFLIRTSHLVSQPTITGRLEKVLIRTTELSEFQNSDP
jgi:hypothetical protein